MSPFRFFATLSTAILLAGSAAAQSGGSRIIVEPATPAARQEGTVRVQSNINLFMPGPTGDGDASQALRDRARRTIYEMAARECDLLREVLAKDCRLESINTNINRQWGQQQQEGYNVGGSMSLQITLK
jgi:hypothetical protein